MSYSKKYQAGRHSVIYDLEEDKEEEEEESIKSTIMIVFNLYLPLKGSVTFRL